MILNTLPYRALGEYPVTHGDAMGYEFVAPSGREHQIADNHYTKKATAGITPTVARHFD